MCCFLEKNYTAGNIFTRPPVVTVATNFKSGFISHCSNVSDYLFNLNFFVLSSNMKSFFLNQNRLSYLSEQIGGF